VCDEVPNTSPTLDVKDVLYFFRERNAMIALTEEGLVITGERIYIDPGLRDKWSWTLYSKLRMIIRCQFSFDKKATSCCRMAFSAFNEFDNNKNYTGLPVLVAQNTLEEAPV
jgi:hypothetical protein